MNYVKDDNPAGRLYFILKKASQCAASIQVQEVWMDALEAKDLSETDFHRRIIMMQELVEEVKERVNSVESLNQEMLLKKFHNIEKATSTLSLNVQWQGQKALLDEATLNSLEFCSEELSRHKVEDKIEDDILVDFDREINEMIGKLHSDEEIGSQVRILLIDQLNVILRSIQEYRLRGVKGLHDSLSLFYGHLILQHKVFEDHKDKESIKETLSLVAKIADTATKAMKFGEIAYSGIKHFFLN